VEKRKTGSTIQDDSFLLVNGVLHVAFDVGDRIEMDVSLSIRLLAIGDFRLQQTF
jgi:hypothetical protein